MIYKNKTVMFGLLTAILITGIYIFDYQREQKKNAEANAAILSEPIEQISYIQLIKPEGKIGVQRSESGWTLLEPIQDRADNEAVEEFLQLLAGESRISVVKKSEVELTVEELAEFGLDRPILELHLKNNLGKTQKISVGANRNFEGNSYLRLGSSYEVLLASPAWHNFAQNELIYYREKKLYRSSLAQVNRVKVRSLSDDFEIFFREGKWQTASDLIELDQNKVREVLKKISENKIIKYVYEGEPSSRFVNEKGLSPAPVSVSFFTDESHWQVHVNLSATDKLLYALTERPTYLVQLEAPEWELFGNLSLDGLRDRTSVLAFNINDVKKVYYKIDSEELSLELKDDEWQVSGDKKNGTVNQEQVRRVIARTHDLAISEFIDDEKEKKYFQGQNMLILKSDTDRLVLQLNWGPEHKLKKGGSEREYFYARTHLSDKIFSLDKKLIESLELKKMIKTAEAQPETPIE